MYRMLIVFTLLFISLTGAMAQGVVLAEWGVYAESFEVEVTGEEKRLCRDVLDYVNLRYGAGFRGQWESEYFADFEIESSRDAVEFSGMELFNYLLYGSLRKSGEFYLVSLVLFDGRGREELGLITVEARVEGERPLAELVGERIVRYMVLNGYLYNISLGEEGEEELHGNSTARTQEDTVRGGEEEKREDSPPASLEDAESAEEEGEKKERGERGEVEGEDVTNDLITSPVDESADVVVIEEKKRLNPGYFVAFNWGVGYQLPLSWWSVLTGVVSVETGIKVVNLELYSKGLFGLSLRPGFSFSYRASLNKPGRVESLYNSLVFSFPLELCFELAGRHNITVGTGVQGQLDILYRREPFSEPEAVVTGGFGLLAMTGYEYSLLKSGRLAIGFNNIFDFSFYENIYIGYSLQVTLLFRLGREKRG